MPDLNVEVEYLKEVPKCAMVVIAGAIDAKTVPGFQEHLNKLKDSGIIRFVLDMENVKYINSTGLGFLVNLADNIDPVQGGVSLVRVPPKVKVVFDMLGLNTFFKIFNSRREAMEASVKAYGGTAAAPAPAPAPVHAPAPVPISRPATATAPRPVTGAAVATKGATPPPPARPVSSVAQRAPAAQVAPVYAPPPVAAQVVEVECQSCHATLTVPEAGTFKCPRCSAIFSFSAGKTNFLPRRKMAPLQLTLSSTPECTEALCFLVGLMCNKIGMNPDAAQQVPGAVREAVTTVIDRAYGNNDQCTYQVLVVTGENEISIKIADYGRKIDPNGVDTGGASIFGYTRQVMDVFDLRSHPKGGNILTIGKRL